MALGEATDRAVQARSVATRNALLDAALETVVERGYAATTTIETARRAGVSRGAQLHHFPTKAELLTAAVQHLLERRMEEFAETFTHADLGADRLDAAIDLLWSMFQGPVFVAWVELWIAARTDPELARAITAMEQRFTIESSAMFLELFPPEEGGDPALFEIGRDFVFALMTGVAFQRLVPRGQRPASDYLDALKQMLHSLQAP
ncbi:MAG: TetR/AcrR family transcriptional regulator [Acidimicrobiia bacterium]